MNNIWLTLNPSFSQGNNCQLIATHHLREKSKPLVFLPEVAVLLLPLTNYCYCGTISFFIVGRPVSPIRHSGIRKTMRRISCVSHFICGNLWSSYIIESYERFKRSLCDICGSDRMSIVELVAICELIIYKQQFLHSDWLRTLQFIPNSAEKWNCGCKTWN